MNAEQTSKAAFITITLTKTVPAVDYDANNSELTKLIYKLAESGWDLNVEELKLKKAKLGGIVLGNE